MLTEQLMNVWRTSKLDFIKLLTHSHMSAPLLLDANFSGHLSADESNLVQLSRAKLIVQ